jgi:putative transposase
MNMAYSIVWKKRVLKHVALGIAPVATVALLKRVPRQTIYRWKNRHKRYGDVGLANRKPGAKSLQINESFARMIVALWNQHPVGCHKMWRSLHDKGYGVAQRQIQKLYRQSNLKMNKRSRPSQINYVRYERSTPNELWHTDWTSCPFTGKQLIAFIDDHSRFIVHAQYFDNATTENTLAAFENAIQKCGVPQEIITDNGTQFTPARAQRGPFTQWCEDHNIKHILGRVHHPQTNGKIERWFGTYKQEFQDDKDTLESFTTYYNEERLHQSLGYKVPRQRYKCNINAV